ncbi:dTMP kinase [Alkalicoccus urumqiensis]|uniref:Thymidylate kinase n=1 Tax=Alkalicoccus urumqiensis TaxID=1548213 RepID=A0A2P6MDT3_ALKUR|nr:dTMP kinase [Alkalicoccus urumqiensis]PRO64416.1 dTMP kinase [Alkalicoccus urumqiensis]
MCMFMTVEGGEGAGKTTVLHEAAERLRHLGYDVMTTREPGGSRIAEKIRTIILDPGHTEMDARTEALLYAAARRQHLVEKVLPALEKGTIVFCDRFVDSSLVYQGYARGIGVKEVWDLNMFATGGLSPDLTLYFDIDPETGLKRIMDGDNREFNRLDQEALSFHEDVRKQYLTLQQEAPERIQLIDAARPLEAVVEQAVETILSHPSLKK